MAACLVKQGCPPEKIRVHHLGVDADKIPLKARQWDGREPLRVLIAGTFVEKKGIPDALMALAEVRKKIPIAITLIGDAHP